MSQQDNKKQVSVSFVYTNGNIRESVESWNDAQIKDKIALEEAKGYEVVYKPENNSITIFQKEGGVVDQERYDKYIAERRIRKEQGELTGCC